MRKKTVGVVGVLIVLLVGCSFGQNTPTQRIYLRCGSLFDGRSDSLQRNVLIVIEGERIVSLGQNAVHTAAEIDLSHETCLPWDFVMKGGVLYRRP